MDRTDHWMRMRFGNEVPVTAELYVDRDLDLNKEL